MVVQHVDEPLVGFMACGEAVGGRESERHLGGWHVRVGILAADGESEGVSSLASCCFAWLGVVMIGLIEYFMNQR